MTNYLTVDDLKKGVFGEVLNVVSRNEANCIQGISEAMAEVESYLCNRYDIAKELEKTAPAENATDTRVPLVMKLVRDIALYNIFNIANPVSIPENRRERYRDSIELLKSVQSGKASIPSLERLMTDADGNVSANNMAYGNTAKRQYQL